MSIDEAARLGGLLANDPGSHLFAAIWGWEYPLSREALTLADLWDATAVGKIRNFKPYHRPLPDRSVDVKGDGGGMTSDEVKALLRPERNEVSSG